MSLVTIVMAAYNGQPYIRQQLKSLEEQTYKEWRLLVRDDGSQDDTLLILKEFADRVPQQVAVIENQETTGEAKKNFALLLQDAAEAGSEYVMCCDQDDVWYKDKIGSTLRKMQDIERKRGKGVPILVHTDLEVADDILRIQSPSFFRLSHLSFRPTLAELLVQNNVTGCTMMMNRSLLLAIAGHVGREEVIMHDYWAALYASVFGVMDVIDQPTMAYRQHGHNSVGAKDSKDPFYLSRRLVQGKKNYQREMAASWRQIRCFLECYGDSIQKKETRKESQKTYQLLEEYGRLGERSHRKRVRFYRENGAWKQGRIRRWMQRLWG